MDDVQNKCHVDVVKMLRMAVLLAFIGTVCVILCLIVIRWLSPEAIPINYPKMLLLGPLGVIGGLNSFLFITRGYIGVKVKEIKGFTKVRLWMNLSWMVLLLASWIMMMVSKIPPAFREVSSSFFFGSAIFGTVTFQLLGIIWIVKRKQ